MNVIKPLPSVRVLVLCVLWMLDGGNSLFGQGPGPYKLLETAAGLSVSDTVAGLNLAVIEVSPQAKHGDVIISVISQGGTNSPYVFEIQYIPDAGFVGLDTFVLEYQYIGTFPHLIYKGYEAVVRPSKIMTGTDMGYTTEGNPVTLDVLANDDATHPPLTLSSVPVTNNGSASISNNHLVFTPDPGFTGVAHVNYLVCDALNNCITASSDIAVTPLTLPSSDTLRVSVAKNTTLRMPLPARGFAPFNAPLHGLVTVLDSSVFLYTPDANFTGKDTFRLENTYYSNPFYKTVFVTVLNTNTPNDMALDDRVYTPKGQPITFNVRDNDIGSLPVKSWVIPNNLAGTLSGTTSTGNVTFTPDPNFTGVAVFYYKIGNMFVPDLEMAAVSVVVGNLAPTEASYDLTTPRETPFVVNYALPFGDYEFSVTDPPGNGSCQYYPGFSTQTINGQPVSGYNLLVYTPEAGYIGVDAFEIKYCIASSGQCQTVKISMNVTEVLSAPAPYCVTSCVWPGDVNNDGTVNNRDLLPLGYAMGRQGPVRNNAAFEWFGQTAGNWADPFLPYLNDLKHADTDGNGSIDQQDTTAISFFYGQTHQLSPHLPPAGKGLPFFFELLTPNPQPGDLVVVQVSLGSQSTPVTNVYGFTLNINLGNTIQDSALQMVYYNNSWINRNAPSLWMSKTPRHRRLETAFTRTNEDPISGDGVIGQFSFIIIDIVIGGKPCERDYAVVEVEATDWMDASGNIQPGNTFYLQIPLKKPTISAQPAADKDLLVYPSPAADRIQVQLNGDRQMEACDILDLTGRVVWHADLQGVDHTALSVAGLPEGIYFLRAHTGQEFVTRKFEVQR